MSPHFKSYVSNLNRVRLVEMIDHHAARVRYAKARLSIVHNPLSDQLRSGDDRDSRVVTTTNDSAALTTLL